MLNLNDVRLAKNKDKNALERVLTDINPLIKKYASYVQNIEYEDACQELCLSLIRCIYKMSRIEDIGQCLVCFKICMSYEILAMNRRAAAEKCIMRFENLYDLPIAIDDWQLELSETLVDLETALETGDSKAVRRETLIFAFSASCSVDSPLIRLK